MGGDYDPPIEFIVHCSRMSRKSDENGTKVLTSMEYRDSMNLPCERGENMKISISLADDLLQRTDDFADQNGMTRSGLISVALRQYMNTIEAMPSMTQLVKKLAAVDLQQTLTSDQKAALLSELDADQQTILDLMKK